MKNKKINNDTAKLLRVDTTDREFITTIIAAFKQYEWKLRSERIKAGIREAKLRKANKAV